MKTTNQIIEEGIVQAKTIGINFDYDDGTSAEWLRLYSERLVEAERGRIKRHIGEWDSHSRSDAEFAGSVRHYFREIIT